jgi:hypothetical protein
MAALGLGLSTWVGGQGNYYGGLTGTVTDPTGAVIPGVEVTVTNLAKGTVVRTISGDTGLYRVDNLTPMDSYRIEAELPGFKRYVRSPILVESNRTVTVDIGLEIGESTEEVTVHGAPPLLETESGQTATTVEGDLILKAPVQPGANRSDARVVISRLPSAKSGDSGRMLVNGASATQTDFAIDGAPNRGARDGVMMTETNIVWESVRAVKLTLMNAGAESRAPAQANFLTRSGSNEIHGAGFYQAFHSAFSAFNHSTPIENRTSAKRAFQRVQFYGGTASGPVYLPGLYDGRDRTFWMVSLELNNAVTPRANFWTVPTAAMLGGDFSQLFNASGKLIAIKDPLTGQPFEGNVIPASRIYAGGVNYLKALYPTPNQETATFSRNYFTPADQVTRRARNRFDIRVDHRLSDRNNFFVRYNRNDTDTVVERLGTGDAITPAVNDNYHLNDTHTFTNRLLNEFRLAKMGRLNDSYNERRPAELVAMLGVQGIPEVLTQNATGLPTLSISNVTALAQAGTSSSYERTYEIYDNVSYLVGRHAFKLGVNVRRDAHTGQGWETAGNFSFDGFFTGFGLADFLLGLPHTSRRVYPRAALGPEDRRGWYTGLFVQDDFKITPRLTLNLGLRWDVSHPVVETNGLYYNFDPRTGNLVMPTQQAIDQIVPAFPAAITAVTAAEAGFPARLRNTDRNNLAPRLGIAWRPWGENTVIRTAYGIYIDQPSFEYLPMSGPWGGTETFTNKLVGGTPWFQFPAAFPAGAAGSIPGTVGVGAFNPDFVNPYTQQWNLTVERQMGAQVTRVQYVGTKSTNLNWILNLNIPAPSATPFSNSRRPWPQYQNVNYRTQGGNSNYHALLLGTERRLSGGLSFSSNFAWSRLFTDSYPAGSDTPGLQDRSGRWYPTLDRARWKGNDTDNPKFRWVTVWLAELPFGEGKRWGGQWNGLVDSVLGGWIWAGIFNWETGAWVGPYYSAGRDPANINVFSGPPDRLGDGGFRNEDLQPGDTFLDPSAFVLPPVNAGRLGNSGTNFLQTPSYWTADFTLGKNFQLWESLRLEFESKLFNVFNHGAWANSSMTPGLDVNDQVNFGKMVQNWWMNRTVTFVARVAW